MANAQEVAEELAEYVRDQAEKLGQDTALEVTLKKENGHHRLYWEAGPENWAFHVAVGRSVWDTDNGPEVEPMDLDGVWVEPRRSFSLVIGNY